MGVIEGSTLTAFMDAVTDYYGTDIWNTITNNAAFTSADFASKITQVDGVSATYLANGKVAYYTYNGQIVAQGNALSNLVNSNTGNIVESTAVEIPAETSIVSGTNQVVANSGMTATATGLPVQTVVKDVAVGIGAVAAGIQAGAKFSEVLYQTNPQFWDSLDMGTLNPQTWDSICTTENGKRFFNFAFGINKNTGETIPYMDEKAYAYIVGYLESKKAFDEYSDSVIIDDTTGLNMDGISLPILTTGQFSRIEYYHDQQYLIQYSPGNYTTPVSFAVFSTNTQLAPTQLIFASETPFTVKVYQERTQITEHFASTPVTFNGKSFYMYQTAGSYYSSGFDGIVNQIDSGYSQVSSQSVAYILLYGTSHHVSGVKGIDKQPGATIPTGITDPSDIDDILTKLRQQYPELFEDTIENDVVQDDGTIDHHIYIPVVIPDSITQNQTSGETEPTGGIKQKQGNQAITKDSIDEAIKNLIDIITSTDPSNPTKPPSPTETPDIGTGTTPTVITPTGSASALYSIYNPSQAQLNSLGAWLWSSNFVDQLLKVFNDPMQAIIGLHKIFVSPPVSGTGTIKVGYLDSGVSSNLVSSQYTEVNCGNVNILEYFGNTLDYTNTDIYIYLPFIGIVPLNTSDVMRGTINVRYKVDVLTGACIAMVNVLRDGNAGGQLYCYTGNCAAQYPLSSGSYMGILSGALGIAASAVSAFATGGATIPLALGMGASALTGMKTKVEHSGSLSGNAGALGIKKPYLIIRRPQSKIAVGYEIFAGSTNNIIVTLSQCTGFTKAKYAHLQNIPATDNELSEIQSLLESGIII